MEDATPNKHQARTDETRRLLLQAAEAVFVRDGYEAAQLEEIATLAGRTKGSIYAQFKSKEDLFFVLFEGLTDGYRAGVEELLKNPASKQENIAKIKEFHLRFIKKSGWLMLILEFKLFALRHPESKARIRKAIAAIYPPDRERSFAKIFGSGGRGKQSISRSAANAALVPMLSGLLLAAHFEPTLLGEAQLQVIVSKVFDALMAAPRQRTRKESV